GPRVCVEPRRHVHHRGVDVLVVEPLAVDAKLLPEAVEDAMLPLIEQIALVFRSERHGRVAAAPWPPEKPVAYVDRLHGGELCRIALQLRTLERLIERPRGLLELERTALTELVLVRVREATRIKEHGDDAWRTGTT